MFFPLVLMYMAKRTFKYFHVILGPAKTENLESLDKQIVVDVFQHAFIKASFVIAQIVELNNDVYFHVAMKQHNPPK